MIKLTKGNKPNILVERSEVWRDELVDYIRRGVKIPKTVASRYNNDEVKSALKKECSSKCMYCESKVDHVAYEHIEHIKPKAIKKFPELTFEWSNLGLACPICNGNKGDEYEEDNAIINPYVDNPEDFIFAYGVHIFAKPGQSRADLTIRLLDLNRPELIEQRLERARAIHMLIDSYYRAVDLTLKKLILREIYIEVGPDKPYSLTSKLLINSIESEK